MPKKLKLYKFRSLGDCDSLERAESILETGEFWCAKLWDMNDPMEGIFTYERHAIGGHILSNFFSAKNRRVICSFSGERAFKWPTMWGYYANGFKGVAIELEVDDSEVEKVKYAQDVAAWVTASSHGTDKTRLKRILTTKLRSWSIEAEYRFIAESDSNCSKAIGRITGVHFGWPYKDVGNARDVLASSAKLRDYVKRANRLLGVAIVHSVPCFIAFAVGAEVVSEPFSGPELP